ncbi:hypothetical protein QBC46DRAFT_431520 [Diplogelasinospora grovesii]|uniref:Uncharacterized protein n=1 Tax=Diplogelasinospora grovesii TaxID=303347 RepID=A0AAN6MUJ0_9PEZI|nr:hypothetical protein QBC46DRAFT_431520 [Diplogelasinospora grovesii]
MQPLESTLCELCSPELGTTRVVALAFNCLRFFEYLSVVFRELDEVDRGLFSRLLEENDRYTAWVNGWSSSVALESFERALRGRKDLRHMLNAELAVLADALSRRMLPPAWVDFIVNSNVEALRLPSWPWMSGHCVAVQSPCRFCPQQVERVTVAVGKAAAEDKTGVDLVMAEVHQINKQLEKLHRASDAAASSGAERTAGRYKGDVKGSGLNGQGKKMQ